VSIMYAVGNYIRAFDYQLELGASAQTPRQMPLSEFREVGLLQANWTDGEWPVPSDVPTTAFGGIRVQLFPLPGQYLVAFLITGRTAMNAAEEHVRMEKTVTISRRPLQVQELHVGLQMGDVNYEMTVPLLCPAPNRRGH